MVLVTLDNPYQFPRWWQHSEAIWPLSDNCLRTRIFLRLCWGQSQVAGLPQEGVSSFPQPWPGEVGGRARSPLPTGLCWNLLKPWFPFPLSKAVGRGFPQHGHGAANRGRPLGDPVLGSGTFDAGGLISAPQDGSLPEHSVCHDEKLRFTNSTSQPKNTSQNRSSDLPSPVPTTLPLAMIPTLSPQP